MKTNMVNINQRDEEKSFYKCHFCYQKIDMYGIEQHFATFHKFRHSYEREYICEFCDDFEDFHSQTSLFHHIQNFHNLKNDEEIQSEAIENVDTLEEGKSRFLQLIVNFNSKEDVFNFLQWIKSNDTNTFITNHQEKVNQRLVFEENISITSIEDDAENILHENLNSADSNSEADLEEETNVILTQKEINTFMNKQQGIEKQCLIDQENVSEICAKDDARNVLHEDLNSADSNSEAEFEEETNVILTQKDIDTFMNKQKGIEKQYLIVKENISEISAKEDVRILHEEMDNEDSNSEAKLGQETAVILKNHIQKIHQIHKENKCESCGKFFSRASYLRQHILIIHEGHKDKKCEFCGKAFSQAHSLKRHIQIIHDEVKYKCESCRKNFSTAQYLKQHIHVIHDGHDGHKCDSCGKTFLRLFELERHLHTIHDGYKDYKCEFCGKSFTVAGNLKKHIHRTHEGQKDHT